MSSFPVANVLSFPSGAGLSCSIMSDSLRPPGLYPARPLCPWGFSRQEHWRGLPCPPPADLPNPGIEPRSPTLWADSLPPEPPGKPKSTGVGSVSLLQGIFPTQELNQGFLHCRQILYQLGHLGGPRCLSFLMQTLQFPGLSSTFASLQHPMLQTYECANEPFKSLKIFQD